MTGGQTPAGPRLPPGAASLLPRAHVGVNGYAVVRSIAELLLTHPGAAARGGGWGLRHARCRGPSVTTKDSVVPFCDLQSQESSFLHPQMPPSPGVPSLQPRKPTWHSAVGRGCWSRWKTQAARLWSHSWERRGITDQEELFRHRAGV